ncbi:MAG: RNA methyltransferase [Candidatus Bathyarchaeia archaeon]
MYGKRVSIAIPASVVSDVPHLREKTFKIGLIGRAAAIFGVEEIIIYKDAPKANQKNDMELIATLLNYMETPQYLRKRLFKIRPELRYAGILPPLRTPHHPLKKRTEDLKEGEYREGVVFSKSRKGVFVDIGVGKPALIPDLHVPIGKRVTVKVIEVGEQVLANLSDRQEIPHYWGYSVTAWEGSLGELVSSWKFELKIATSKYGVIFSHIIDELAQKVKGVKTVLMAFGSPSKGLYEIIKDEGLNLKDIFDFVVNTIPGQKTETVRTEEALIVSLAVFNCFWFKV